MLYYLFKYLQEFGVTGSGLFNYISFRSAMAVITSLLITMIFGKRFIKYMKRRQIGESVRDLYLDGQKQKTGTPTMGGIMIIAAIIIPVLLFAELSNPYILLLLFTTVWLGAIGFMDDYIKVFKKNKDGLNSRAKLAAQIFLGIVVGMAIYLSPDTLASACPLKTTLPFVKDNEFDYSKIAFFIDSDQYPWVGWIIFIIVVTFIITAVSNGANMTDGLDGLASGTSAVSAATLLVFAYVSGNAIFSQYLKIMYLPGIGELVVFASAFIGATIGFLWYNAYPAQIFMGDTGSLTIGGIIAVLAILVRKELLIPIFCGIFLVENVSVMAQVWYFKRTLKKYGCGMHLFLMAPLHHHYQKKGIPEPKIVARFIIVAIILAVISVITLKIR
ncbi:MAG: phospho-N-acetylmuramoyl-pentapeptide-transferase [Bacteroidales bacterium]|nr:phospho-N-acetylmuramoyl-pentapeptide-transferase [Bacteroidales bacterium]